MSRIYSSIDVSNGVYAFKEHAVTFCIHHLYCYVDIAILHDGRAVGHY